MLTKLRAVFVTNQTVVTTSISSYVIGLRSGLLQTGRTLVSGIYYDRLSGVATPCICPVLHAAIQKLYWKETRRLTAVPT